MLLPERDHQLLPYFREFSYGVIAYPNNPHAIWCLTIAMSAPAEYVKDANCMTAFHFAIFL